MTDKLAGWLTNPDTCWLYFQNSELFEMVERIQGHRIDDQRFDMATFLRVRRSYPPDGSDSRLSS